MAASYPDAPTPGTGAAGSAPPSELVAFLTLLRRRKWIIILFTLLGLGLALALAFRAEPVYRAQVLLQVNSPAGGQSSANDVLVADIGQAKTYKELITDRTFLTAAAAAPGIGLDPDELIPRVSATAVAETQLVKLQVDGPSPAEARRLAQSLAEYTVGQVAAQGRRNARQQSAALQSRLDTSQAELERLRATRADVTAGGDATAATALEDQIRGLEAAVLQLQEQIYSGEARATTLSVTNAATALPSPVSPRPLLSAVVGTFFGLVIGTALAFVRHQLDRRVRSVEEIEQIFGEPVLAAIPVVRGRAGLHDGALANAFDVLRANLAIVARRTTAKVYTVTSSRENEGKTFTTIGLGLALARAGRRVVLVDADLRRRGLSLELEAERRPGLTEALHGDGAVDEYLVAAAEGMHLLPAGAGNERPPTLLDTRAFDDALAELRTLYDVILVDTPPLLNMADSVLVSGRTDGVLVVVRANTATRPDLTAVADQLRSGRFAVLGEVMHSTDTAAADYTSYNAPAARRRLPLLRGARSRA
ncbi:MAG: hypothetical protein AVDCRST_MAG79-3141 [uncultured Thermoleophilia bacterium]|uniref:Non-specific protein-tyrosine kinase n=1 Tax=uncultured Thermoleophilia bacterium TaxID=1497501 RepID=A0A6J4UPA0_9ACTN|nr:MAG: hypothetical protein AVDCRST_MAG79-3141 [uncultured Thermoleophilia bacterium]